MQCTPPPPPPPLYNKMQFQYCTMMAWHGHGFHIACPLWGESMGLSWKVTWLILDMIDLSSSLRYIVRFMYIVLFCFLLLFCLLLINIMLTANISADLGQSHNCTSTRRVSPRSMEWMDHTHSVSTRNISINKHRRKCKQISWTAPSFSCLLENIFICGREGRLM